MIPPVPLDWSLKRDGVSGEKMKKGNKKRWWEKRGPNWKPPARCVRRDVTASLTREFSRGGSPGSKK